MTPKGKKYPNYRHFTLYLNTDHPDELRLASELDDLIEEHKKPNGRGFRDVMPKLVSAYKNRREKPLTPERRLERLLAMYMDGLEERLVQRLQAIQVSNPALVARFEAGEESAGKELIDSAFLDALASEVN